MTTSTATIATPKASGYISRMCKHFAHKVETEFTEHEGAIRFPFGEGQLRSTGDELTIQAIAADEARLSQLEDVLKSHFERFATRENLTVEWQRS